VVEFLNGIAMHVVDLDPQKHECAAAKDAINAVSRHADVLF
jgi:hypothetical protein